MCLTPSDPMDCSPPGPTVQGVFQARVLEWGAIAFSSIIPKHIIVCGIWQNLVVHVLLTISAHVKLIHIAECWVECILLSRISSQDPIHQVGEGLCRTPAGAQPPPILCPPESLAPDDLRVVEGRKLDSSILGFVTMSLVCKFHPWDGHLVLGCLGSGLPHLQGPCPSPAPGAATLKSSLFGENLLLCYLTGASGPPYLFMAWYRLPVHRVTTILPIYGVVTFQYSSF